MSVSTPNSILKKAVLAVSNLQGHDDWYLWSTMIHVALGHTWAYVDGDKAQAPTTTDDKYVPWLVEDWNAHQRMFLTLSDDVKQTILMHANSTASALFSALKDQYEHMGISVEFYAKQDFKNAKLSDYNTISDFITGLTNFPHIYNKEVKGDTR